jgi:hypothetical protein
MHALKEIQNAKHLVRRVQVLRHRLFHLVERVSEDREVNAVATALEAARSQLRVAHARIGVA